MTRKDRSKALVAVTGVLVFGAAAVFAGVERVPSRADAASSPAAGPDTPGASEAPVASVETSSESQDTTLVARGRELFSSVGCTACHEAEGVGRRISLDGVGSRLSPDTLRAWIVDPGSVAPGVRKPTYDDLAEEEVDALVAWMQSLTEAEP